jgi:2-polyprenyl-3-methyl-5-hydroxy-6-metoxy-1,4-benzoquinol methylase
MSMEAYYRERAAEYDEFYQVPRRQDGLAQLKVWLIEQVRGQVILEVAAGTGFWTEVAASVAKAITATDYNPETLAIAAKRRLGPHTTLLAADAYRLPEFDIRFDVGMAMLWWSHIEKGRCAEFLAHFTSRLRPGSLVLLIDQNYQDGKSNPISRTDDWGNLYTLRKLATGATYEIVKNYPSDDELRRTFAETCDNVSVRQLGEFWALSARVRAQD